MASFKHKLFSISCLVALTLVALTSGVDMARAADGLCAKVRIEIRQELTFVRQGFDARMRIGNSLDTKSLDNVLVTVKFKDADGNEVVATSDPNDTSAFFFIRIDSLQGIANVSGTGVVAPASTAEIHWLIVPSRFAAEDSPQGRLYYVGATLSFDVGGEHQEIEVAPDFITVKPQPELELDYFLTEEVRADDPFTPQIEPPEPFLLGVRVQNSGLGLAKNVAINSSQPKIIDNDQGLLIGFEIIASSVNEEPTQPTLLINFGDLESGQAKIGRWELESSLSGHFTEFTARFSHADELGGRLTSLLTRVSPHSLIKDVLADIPGRDSISDFLAKDGDVITLYESELNDSLVTDYTGEANLIPSGTDGELALYRLDLPPTAGALYYKGSDPFSGAKTIRAVVRDDGKTINLKNAWLSASGNGNDTQRFFNLFDVNGGGKYIVKFGPGVEGPHPPVLQYIGDKHVDAGQRITFVVIASDADGTVPALSIDALPTGSHFTDNGNGQATFDWQTLEAQAGDYLLTFRASDGQLGAASTITIHVDGHVDLDGDGMNDAWELRYFGDLSRDGSGDFDGDGISDKDEFLNGTDPTVANLGPSKPRISAPQVGFEVSELTPNLVIKNSEHVGAGASYEFELYRDAELQHLLASGQEPQGVATTGWNPPQALQDNTRYYWRARVKTQERYSEWAYGEFFVNTVNDAPSAPHASYPGNGESVDNLHPRLEITNGADPDHEPLMYVFEVATAASVNSIIETSREQPEGLGGVTSWQVQTALQQGARYFWRAVAKDAQNTSAASEWSQLDIDTTNRAPSEPSILSPERGSIVANRRVSLKVSASSDQEGQPLAYLFEVDTTPTFDSQGRQASNPVLANAGLAEYETLFLANDTRYYWRVRAVETLTPPPGGGGGGGKGKELSEGQQRGARGGGSAPLPSTSEHTTLSGSEWEFGSFIVSLLDDRPSAPAPRNPSQRAWINSPAPSLELAPALDPEHEELQYRFELYLDSNLTNLLTAFSGPETSWQVPQNLTNRTSYFWRARVIDSRGNHSASWTPTHEFFVAADTQNDAPNVTLTSPSAPLTIGSWQTLIVRWDDEDIDSNANVWLTLDGQEIMSPKSEDADGGEADSFTFHPSGLSPGSYSLCAKIADEEHESTSNNCVTVTLTGDNSPGPTPVLTPHSGGGKEIFEQGH